MFSKKATELAASIQQRIEKERLRPEVRKKTASVGAELATLDIDYIDERSSRIVRQPRNEAAEAVREAVREVARNLYEQTNQVGREGIMAKLIIERLKGKDIIEDPCTSSEAICVKIGDREIGVRYGRDIGNMPLPTYSYNAKDVFLRRTEG